MANPSISSNADSSITQTSTPNPIPPPPSSTSRRSSSTSFARTTPDRILTEVNLGNDPSFAPIHRQSLLDSPGTASNFSTETTTTIDIPDELDIPDRPGINTTATHHDISQTSVNVSSTDPPIYVDLASTTPMHPAPPIYYPGELPPAYQVAAALPTYEEAELTKGNHQTKSFHFNEFEIY